MMKYHGVALLALVQTRVNFTPTEVETLEAQDLFLEHLSPGLWPRPAAVHVSLELQQDLAGQQLLVGEAVPGLWVVRPTSLGKLLRNSKVAILLLARVWKCRHDVRREAVEVSLQGCCLEDVARKRRGSRCKHLRLGLVLRLRLQVRNRDPGLDVAILLLLNPLEREDLLAFCLVVRHRLESPKEQELLQLINTRKVLRFRVNREAVDPLHLSRLLHQAYVLDRLVHHCS